jgi:peptide/nickel transport system permease protein
MNLRAGLVIVLLATVAAVAGPWLVPWDVAAQDLALRLAGPSWHHPLGLDELGRDILARLLAGARVSLLVGSSVVLLSATVGLVVGGVAGYAGGWVDALVGRVIDVLMAFPGILLAIAMVGALGPSLRNVVVALAVTGWVGYARLVRGQVLKARTYDYVVAARALGAPVWRILWRHVLPVSYPALLVQATLGMAAAIIAEASLSFLGLGVQPPVPSWGVMLDAGRGHLIDAPHLTLFPGLAIAILVLGFNFLGDGLRDLVDPRSSRPWAGDDASN